MATVVIDTITDDQGDELDPLGDLQWELGGLPLLVQEQGDEGLDDVAEIEADDSDTAGDGLVAGIQRLASREVTLNLWIEGVDGNHTEFATKLDELRKVVSPLPDRTALRILRWKRQGEPAKRLWVRPAPGKPLEIPGNRARLQFANTGQAPVVVRLEAPDPVVYSDVSHSLTWTVEEAAAHEIKSVVNAGSFCAVQPCAWNLTAPGPCQISHVGFEETIAFPAGPVTVSRTREILSPSGYGVVYGPGSTLFPRWPLLRPGINLIRADKACTFHWRDTW